MKIIRHMRGFLAVMVCAGLVAACAQRQQEDVPQYDTINVVENFVIDENSVPIFPKKAALTTDTAQRFSIELPKRCKVNWDNQTIVSVVPEEPIEMIRLGVGDALPQLQVTDYEFEQLTVKQALDKLLEGTDISVIEDGEVTQTISGSISAGNLADSVELMSKMGRAYYSYDAVNAEIHLDNRAKWMIKMPKNESIIMALLDAMHGADVRNLLVDWQDKTLVFEGNYQTEREVAKIISDIASKKYMIAWDIDIYRVYPRTDNPIIWMNLLPAFGENNIKMSIPGVPGDLLALLPLFDPLVLVAGGIRHRCPVAPPGHPPNPLRSEDGPGLGGGGARHLRRRRHPGLRPAAGARPGVAPAALRPHPDHPAAPWGTGLPADPGQRLGSAGQRPGHQPHPLGPPRRPVPPGEQGLQPGHRREPGGQPPGAPGVGLDPPPQQPL